MKLNNNHVFLTSIPEVNTIVSPLSAYHINYFAYVRSYHDGSRIYLTNHYSDFRAYLELKQYKKGNCESLPEQYQHQAILWSTLKNQKQYQFSRENFHIDHGLTLIVPNENYCEFYGFASTIDHPEVINFYLNNLGVIKQFTNYFLDKANPLLNQAEKERVYLPYHKSKHNPVYTMNSIQEILVSNKSKLTPRQIDCAKLLMKGETSKQIALRLGLSNRTIENYVDSMKKKLNVSNKCELVARLLNLQQK